MEDPEIGKRRENRITHHYIVRFRQAGALSGWDLSTVRDISKTGMLFNSSRDYGAGSELEIRITTPLLRSDTKGWGTVVRGQPLGEMKNFYEVAINLTKIEEKDREAF